MQRQLFGLASLSLSQTKAYSLLIVLGFGISFMSFGQRSFDWRTNIDNIVEQTDSLSLKSQLTFHLDKPYGKDQIVNETWHYTLHNGKVIIFQIHYVVDSTEYTETYYVHNGRLICREQYETAFFSFFDDDMTWGEVTFFDNNTLKQYVKVGTRKLHSTFGDPQTESLVNFQKRFSELRKRISD